MPAIRALSISRPIRTRLRREPFSARVLAVFERACDLITPDGDVIALVFPTIGDGPLNIVVNAASGDFAELETGELVSIGPDKLHARHLDSCLDSAIEWEPCPDWKALRARQRVIETHLPDVFRLAQALAPPESLLAQQSSGQANALGASALPSHCQQLVRRWNGGWGSALDLAARIAGLGVGLTPAGDDFLCGLMLRAWLVHPDPDTFCHELVQIAAPRTTLLSAAFLKSAARGECSAAWHALLASLSAGRDDETLTAVHSVLAHGATSGADMLAGFCWPGSQPNTLS